MPLLICFSQSHGSAAKSITVASCYSIAGGKLTASARELYNTVLPQQNCARKHLIYHSTLAGDLKLL
jgi:hypothetical protein